MFKFFCFLNILYSLSAFADNHDTFRCPVAREYEVTYHYLQDHKKYKLNQVQIERLSSYVSQYCAGAAGRFVEVLDTLVKVSVDTSTAIKLAKELTALGDKPAHTFLSVFRVSYASDFLDMDLYQSLSLAKSVSTQGKHVPSWLADDYRTLAQFCLVRLKQAKPKCANFVGQLGHIASQFPPDSDAFEESLAKSFISGFKFLAEAKDGPKLATYQAFKIAQDLIRISPYAPGEFKRLYLFAVKRDVRPLNRAQAIDMAKSHARFVRPNKEQLSH